MQAPPIIRSARRPLTWRAGGIVGEVAPFLALAAFTALLLRATLLRGGAMLGFDLFSYFYPGKVVFAEALKRFELPLWNPDVFLGAPFLANIQMAVLYPPNLLFVITDFARAVAFSQWLHLTLAGAGMFLLCRQAWGLGSFPALLSALAFSGGGFFGAHMGHLNQVHAGAWLPWLALTNAWLARRLGGCHWPLRVVDLTRVVPPIVAGGLVVALLLTAGHTQEAYLGLVSVAVLASAWTALPPAWAPRRWPHLAALALMCLNGALLAAGQLVPTLELTGHSYRQGGIPLEDAVAFGVERTYLLESLLPTFWRLPGQEVTGYVGTVTLVLALGALISPARRTVIALAALTLFAVVLTLGTYTPLFGALHRWAPLFDSFRAPGRWLLVSTFALAGLAGHGLHALSQRGAPAARERAVRWFALALAAVGGGAVLFAWRSESVHAVHWLPHARVAVLWLGAALGTGALGIAAITLPARWPSAILATALALELGYAAREMEYNQPGPANLYATVPPVAALLARESVVDGVASRTLSLAAEERLDPERLRRALPTGDGESRRYRAMADVLRPNLGAVFGLPTVDGYDGGLLPLRSFADFKSLLVLDEPPVPHYTLAAQAPARPDPRLLGALDVRFLLLDGRLGSPGPGWTAIEPAPGAAWLYENTSPLGRAYVVTDVRIEPDPRRAISLLRALDLRSSAVIERPTSGLAESTAAAPVAGAPARIVAYSADELAIGASGPGLLVVSDTYYPGWRATVDGVPAALLRTNLHLRGVALAPGAHDVRVWYDPLSVKAGFAVTALALFGNGALLLVARRVRRRLAE